MWIKIKLLLNFIIIYIKIFNHKYVCEIYLININRKITIKWILFDVIKFRLVIKYRYSWYYF